MLDWFAHRVLTLRSLGRWYGRRGYPRSDTFVALPLYDHAPLATDSASLRLQTSDDASDTTVSQNHHEGAAE